LWTICKHIKQTDLFIIWQFQSMMRDAGNAGPAR
jgi:hypothetical protein